MKNKLKKYGYIDMVGDLFYYGHIELIERQK